MFNYQRVDGIPNRPFYFYQKEIGFRKNWISWDLQLQGVNHPDHPGRLHVADHPDERK